MTSRRRIGGGRAAGSRSSGNARSAGGPGRPQGSGIRRTPPAPPPPRGPRPVSVYDDDEPEDDGWGDSGEQNGDWDETPRRAPASRRGTAGRGGRSARGGRGRRGGESSEGTNAFIVALLGWFICAPLCVVGLVMGLNAVSSAKSRGLEPNGLAQAAVWMGGIGVAAWIAIIGLLMVAHH